MKKKFRYFEFLLSIFSISMLLVLGGQVEAATFPDVPEDHTFYEYIENLASMGVVKGYGDGNFKPDELVTRGAMAKFVMGGLGFTQWTDCGDFPDVPPDHSFYLYITSLKCFGVINGYPDGSFRPDEKVTRGQAIKFVVKGSYEAMDSLPAPANDLPFTDVPKTHTFYKDLAFAYGNDVIKGYPNGDFRPDENITRGAISKMITNAQTKLMVGGEYDYETSISSTPGSSSNPGSGSSSYDFAAEYADLGPPAPNDDHSGLFISNVYKLYYPSFYDDYTESDALDNPFDGWFVSPNSNLLGGRNSIGVIVTTDWDDGAIPTRDDCFLLGTEIANEVEIDTGISGQIDYADTISTTGTVTSSSNSFPVYGCYFKHVMNTEPRLVNEYQMVAEKLDEPGYNNIYVLMMTYQEGHSDANELNETFWKFEITKPY